MGKILYTPTTSEASSIQLQATDPVSPNVGDVWFNTTDGEFKYYDGTATRVIDFNSGNVYDAFGVDLIGDQ